MNHNVHHLPRLGLSAAMRLFGLTARALRFYEERGLIEAQRDRLNNRYYDPVARGRLEWIARLRKADISLPEIRQVLAVEGSQARTACAVATLERRRMAVVTQLAAIDGGLADLQDLDVTDTALLSRPVGR